jgi:hypothetical protein
MIDNFIPVKPATPTKVSSVRMFAASVFAVGTLFGTVAWMMALPCWAILLTLPVLALPVWNYLSERAMFHRRLMLDVLMIRDSWVRNILYRGYFRQAALATVACALVALLLASAGILQSLHWVLLLADALVLPILILAIQRISQGHIAIALLPLTSRQWPLSMINIVLIVAGFMTIDFFVGTADTRNLSLGQVFKGGYAEYAGKASCEPVGLVCGLIAGIDRVVWHARQLAIPLLPESWMRYLAWFVSLIQAGLFAYVFHALVVGTIMLTVKPRGDETAGQPFAVAVRAFWGTIILLGCLYLALFTYGERLRTRASEQEPVQSRVEPFVPPCPSHSETVAPLHAEMDGRIRKSAEEAENASERIIREQLRASFQRAEAGVDNYLDWYYSVTGEWARLVATATKDTSEILAERLLKETFGDRFDGEIDGISKAGTAKAQTIFDNFASSTGSELQAKVSSSPCLAKAIDVGKVMNIQHDLLRAGGAASIGAATGAKMLSAKAGHAIAAKIAAKKFGKAAASVAVKAAAKAGVKQGAKVAVAGATGTAICAPAGPFAVVCGGVAALATWIGVDKVFVEVDEFFNRDDTKAEIMSLLSDFEAEVAAEMIATQRALIRSQAQVISIEYGKIFVPARDGV